MFMLKSGRGLSSLFREKIRGVNPAIRRITDQRVPKSSGISTEEDVGTVKKIGKKKVPWQSKFMRQY